MRQPKPFLRTDRALWYVQIDGRQYNLGRDKPAAWAEYHRLMGQRDQLGGREELVPVTVRDLLALFLADTERTASGNTFRWYHHFLQRFSKSLPPGLVINDLKPWHVQRWLADCHWGQSSIRGAIRSVKRAFSWAVDAGHIDRSPVARLSKPANVARQTLLSDAQIALCCTAADGTARELITTLARTGCRVQELCAVEARHLTHGGTRWLFPANEHKTGRRTGSPRVVYLTDDVAEICRRLAAASHDGKLYRNSSGRPWNSNGIRCVFRRLRAKHPTLPRDLCGTLFRHAWITNALRRGVPAAQVAELAGHSDLKMIMTVYSKLAGLHDHLHEAARKAAG